MIITRRQFVAASAATLVTAGSLAVETDSTSGQLVHSVYFWLKNPDSKSDRDELIAGLKTLNQISAIKSLQIGLPANTLKRDVVDNSFSVFELMFFDNVDAQNEYQVHPIHNAFVEKYSHLWDKVKVHDSIMV